MFKMYFCWKDSPTYQGVTNKRYGSVYLFPLNWILPPLKRREVLAHLSSIKWSQMAISEVVKRADACFAALSVKLGNRKYFTGTEPTELDALAFGHLYSILTTDLPSAHLANALRKYKNLLNFCRDIDDEFFKL